jgi:N-acetyl-anhydromuramyl-L-alanine amidase AmpD
VPLTKRTLLLTSASRPGRKIKPKAVVVHWTANTSRGANAEANRNYFQNHPQNKVSAHWIVDDREAILCIPEDEIAYHVGAQVYQPRALKELSSYPNDCTIGVEICVNADADFKRTYRNTVELVADILQRHGWGIDRIWRHYDVTGKDCPRFFVNDATARQFGFESAAAGWQRFKDDVRAKLLERKVASVFADIAGHWAEAVIKDAHKLGLVAQAEKFRPNDPLTRAEAVALIMRLRDLVKREAAEMVRQAIEDIRKAG